MDRPRNRPRAEAALAWAVEAAGRDPGRGYAAGLGDGLLVGLALANIDAEWSGIALDELLQIQQERLAARLAGTPVPAPEIEMHRLLVFAQAQAVLRDQTAPHRVPPDAGTRGRGDAETRDAGREDRGSGTAD